MPRRRRTPEEAREEILAAARDLLATRPADAVSVSAVMAATTLSRKSFYVYFRDRHELITSLVRPLRADADAAVRAWSAEPEFAPAGRRLLLAVGRLYAEHGHLLRALFEASHRDPEAARVWREMTEPVIAVAAEKVRAQQDLGFAAGLDPQAAARTLVGMNLFAFFDRVAGRPDADVEGVVDDLSAIWERLIAPPGA